MGDLSDKGSECEDMMKCSSGGSVSSDGGSHSIKTCADCGTTKTPLRRTENMISGGWTDTHKFAKLFINLYNRNVIRMRPSGSDNLSIYQFTYQEWKQEVLRRYDTVETFDEGYLRELLRKYSKWMQLRAEDFAEGAKRTKISVSGTYVSLNGSKNQIDFDPGCSRPPGRNLRKKTVVDDDYKKEIKELSSALHLIGECAHKKNRFKSLAFLAKDFSHLPPSDQSIMEEEKNRIRKELTKQIDFNLGCSRPPGRNRRKKTVVDDDYKKEIKELSSALRLIGEARHKKYRFKSLAFLAKDFSHLPPSDQSIMEEEKNRIRKELTKQ